MPKLDFSGRLQRLEFFVFDHSSPSLYACIALLATVWFYWEGVDLLTPFVFPFLAFGIWIMFAAVFVGAIICAMCSKEGKGFHRWRFVALDFGVAMFAVFFPVDEIKMWCDFNLNMGQRMAVIRQIAAGKLARPHDHNKQICALPFWSQYLSRGGGEVIAFDAKDNTSVMEPSSLRVFFFTYRGILQRHSGFEYTADDTPPADSGEAKEIVHLRKNWYWEAY